MIAASKKAITKKWVETRPTQQTGLFVVLREIFIVQKLTFPTKVAHVPSDTMDFIIPETFVMYPNILCLWSAFVPVQH